MATPEINLGLLVFLIRVESLQSPSTVSKSGYHRLVETHISRVYMCAQITPLKIGHER